MRPKHIFGLDFFRIALALVVVHKRRGNNKYKLYGQYLLGLIRLFVYAFKRKLSALQAIHRFKAIASRGR
ncbi:hypothetical protein CREGCYN_03230 [Synechococcus sp. M16CYN]